MIVLPVEMLIGMCLGRLEALVPIAPALAPLADALHVLRETPTSDSDYIRVERLQSVLATVEVKLHAAAKASNRARIDELSALVVSSFTHLDVMAAGAVMERIVKT